MDNIYFYLVIGIFLYFSINYILDKFIPSYENFDPSLVPVSSIITLAKVAQKITNGNGVLLNPGNLQLGTGSTAPGTLTVNGTITLTGNTAITGTLNAGATTLSSASVSGTLGAGATTLSSATVSGTLGAGATTLSSLNVTGATTINGTLGAGTTTLSSATVSGELSAGATTLGNTIINGTLNTTGLATLSSATVSGALTAGTTTLGSAIINGNLTVNNGTITTDNVIINGINIVDRFFKMTFLSAVYGVASSPTWGFPGGGVDTTQRAAAIRALMATANTNKTYLITYTGSNDYGDPSPYFSKSIWVSWKCGTVDKSGSWGENVPFTISCP